MATFSRAVFLTAVLLGAMVHSGMVTAGEAGAEKPVVERTRAPEGPSPLAPNTEFDLEKNYNMQRAGIGLLITGLIIDITGIVLIEADPWGKVGLSGFVSVGVGIACWTVASFLLGFSRPVHGEYQQQKHRVVATVGIDGDGVVFGYGKNF